LQAENIALRHQLTVLERAQKPKRPVLKPWDRCLWVWLSRLWTEWRSALIIVKPETVSSPEAVQRIPRDLIQEDRQPASALWEHRRGLQGETLVRN
jgi:hypothetical protein